TCASNRRDEDCRRHPAVYRRHMHSSRVREVAAEAAVYVDCCASMSPEDDVWRKCPHDTAHRPTAPGALRSNAWEASRTSHAYVMRNGLKRSRPTAPMKPGASGTMTCMWGIDQR